jgi:transposase-like protein
MEQVTKDEIIKKIEDKEIKQSRAIWKFLSNDVIAEIKKSFGKTKTERLYNWLYDVEKRNCKHCKSSNTISFSGFTQGYNKFCSPNCASTWYRENATLEQKEEKNTKISIANKNKSPEEMKIIETKRKQTKFLRYGDEEYNNPEQNKRTMVEKYGAEHALQVPEFNEKFKHTLENKDWSDANEQRKKTLLERTGYNHQLQNPKVKEKMKNTNMLRYGVENPSQCIEIAERKIQTHRKNYGVDYPAQHTETFIKQRIGMYSLKPYITPSGKTIFIQGYENFALDELFKIYDEDEIITDKKKIPEIWYENKGKKCKYIPDIFIEKENKIIEIKSTYTIAVDYETNLLKKNSCLNLGFVFEFRIYSSNGKYTTDEKQFLPIPS